MHKRYQQFIRRILALSTAIAIGIVAFAGSISLDINKQQVRAALAQLEKVSDIHFFYESSLPDLNKVITVNINNATVQEAVAKILSGTNLEYEFRDNNTVVIYNKKATETDKQAAEKASSFTINGIITDAEGEPLIGATVRNVTNGTSVNTDVNGAYRLPGVRKGDKIEVSYVGFQSYEVKVNGEGAYDAQLAEASNLLSDVVVVGYGTQKKVNLTGAVSVIKAKDITGRPTANAATAIQGADPSLNLTFGSGGPNAGYSVNIRGVASINGGSPLILVDGVEMNLSRVNANDIESVSILKDASAAAIYGAKASSGVVLITTKSGEDKKPVVSVDIKAGWKAPTASTDFITTGFWSAYINDMFMYEHGGYNFTTYTEADYAEMWMRLDQKTETAERPWAVVQNDKSYKYYANFDWYNHYFKTKRPMQDYNISITGGNSKTRYYVSGRMYLEDGMMRQNNDKMKSFSSRGKIDVQITDWLKYGMNASLFSSDYNYPGSNDLQYNFKAMALHALAYVPSYNPDGTSVYLNQYNYNGSLAVGDGLNAVLNNGKHTNVERNREFLFKHDIEISPLKWWKINADYSYLYRSYAAEYRRVPVPYSQYEGVISYIDPAQRSIARDQYAQRLSRVSTHTYNVYTTLSPSFGENNFKLMLGMNSEVYHFRSLKATRLDLLSTELDSFNLATGEVSELTENIYNSTTNGFFGRLNYDYAGKYLLEVSGRYDGSSRFAKDHRWGFFPSASAGWRMSEEKFWEPIAYWFNMSKLRLSVGSLGNQQVGYYDYIQTIDTSLKNTSITLDGNTQLSYATEGSPVASDLTWEKINTYDLGLDLAFLSSRLSFTGDLYIRDTKGMLSNGISLPAVYGASVPRSNCADLRTKGYEFSLTWNDNVTLFGKNLRYSVGAGLGDYISKITKFDNPTKLLSDYYEGQTLGELWGYHILGLFPDDETAAAYTVDQSSVNSDINAVGPSKGVHGGDMIYADLDGDGKISIGDNTADNPGDRKVIGNTRPRYNYNFRASAEWNGFDFSIFFQGIGRRNWYPAVEATTFWGPYSRPYQAFISKEFLTDFWTEDNPDGYFPRWRGYEALGSTNQLGPANDRYMQNLAYLRLKNLTVGYTLPWLKKYVSQIRIYFSGENLAFWSPFKKHCKSIDPETAATVSTGNNYGFSKSFTFGLNVEF